MRRGLIKWEAEELPVAVLRDRAQRLQQAMTAAGLHAVILYTNFIRCAAVSWLTGFSPYWGDGIVVVMRERDPLLCTMLSKRMEGWIQSVMPGASVATSATPGKVAGQKLNEAGARRIGILELDDFPAGLYADLTAALPGAEFSDATAIFASARTPADGAERQLLSRADQIAADSLSQLASQIPSIAGEAGAVVERNARLQGAEEIYVAVAPDLDRSRSFVRISGGYALGRRFAIRATVAYKGNWVRRIRTFSQDTQDWPTIRRVDAWFTELIGTLSPRKLDEEIARQVTVLPNATLQTWFIEAAAGTRPLCAVSAESPAADVVLTVGLTVADVPWVGAGLMPFQ